MLCTLCCAIDIATDEDERIGCCWITWCVMILVPVKACLDQLLIAIKSPRRRYDRVRLPDTMLHSWLCVYAYQITNSICS